MDFFNQKHSKRELSVAFKNKNATDAIKAFVVYQLSGLGYQNKDIRHILRIPKVYTVTHLKRAGSLSNDELNLWHKNPNRISLGHVRAIAKLPQKRRESLLRDLLVRHSSVHAFEMIASGKTEQEDADMRSLTQSLESKLQRPVSMHYDRKTGKGSMTFSFYGVDDLETLLEQTNLM